MSSGQWGVVGWAGQCSQLRESQFGTDGAGEAREIMGRLSLRVSGCRTGYPPCLAACNLHTATRPPVSVVKARRVAHRIIDPLATRLLFLHRPDWSAPAGKSTSVTRAALASADVVTIPPRLLPKMADHQYSRDTVRQSEGDASKALARMRDPR